MVVTAAHKHTNVVPLQQACVAYDAMAVVPLCPCNGETYIDAIRRVAYIFFPPHATLYLLTFAPPRPGYLSSDRYLLNSIGLVAWGRMVLGRSLLATSSPARPPKVSVSTPGSERPKSRSAAMAAAATAAAAGGLSAHVQERLLFLLTRLLRSGRRLPPRPPALLEDEFLLLAPDVVRCAAAAAAAAATAAAAAGASWGQLAGKCGGTRGGGGGRGGRAGDDSAAAAAAAVTHADVAARAVALLEEVQLGERLPPASAGEDDGDGAVLGSDEGGSDGGLRGGMRLTLDEALSLSTAVDAMVESDPKASASSSSSSAPDLKMRVGRLLASPGAVEASTGPAAAVASSRHGK